MRRDQRRIRPTSEWKGSDGRNRAGERAGRPFQQRRRNVDELGGWAAADRGGGDLLVDDRAADGRPHVTPHSSVWTADAAYSCTGASEQKARNLETKARCVLTTGCNEIGEGLDVVIEGDAGRVTDDAKLQAIAELYEAKYGREWHFDVHDDAFHGGGGPALVFEVAPRKVFGFRKREEFSQTRSRFRKR